MSALERAMAAAQERKEASIGSGQHGIILADDDFQDRAIFSGFDIEYGELVATSIAVAEIYTQAAYHLGLRPLFISAWCDGLLTGLLLASLPPTSESGATDGTGQGGNCGYKDPPCIYCQHGQRCPYSNG